MKCAAALLACLAVDASAAGACPPEVRVSFPNFAIPPLVLGSADIAKPPGLLVSWTRNAYRNTECTGKLILMRRPPNRQLAEIQAGSIDFLPGFSPGVELPEVIVFPMRDGAIDTRLRLLGDVTHLYVRAGDTQVKWDGKQLSGPNIRVGTSTGGSKEKNLHHSQGWAVELAPTPQMDLQKLIAGRVDVIYESESVIDPLLKDVPVRKLTPPLAATLRYAPVRKGFQQQYPEFTARFWLEMCRQSRLTYPQLPECR